MGEYRKLLVKKKKADCIIRSILYLSSALVFLQRRNFPVPLAFCGSVALLLLFHLTHQRHLVDNRKFHISSLCLLFITAPIIIIIIFFNLGLLHLGDVELQFLELLLVLRLVLEQPRVLLLGRLELLQLLVHGAQLPLVLDLDPLGLFFCARLHRAWAEPVKEMKLKIKIFL